MSQIPIWSNITSVTNLMIWADFVSNGLYSLSILISTFLIVLVLSSRFNKNQSVSVAAFITLLVSVFLKINRINTSNLIVLVPLLVLGVSVVYNLVSSKKIS